MKHPSWASSLALCLILAASSVRAQEPGPPIQLGPPAPLLEPAPRPGLEHGEADEPATAEAIRLGRPTSLVDSAACASDEYPTPRLFSLAPERSAEATILQAAWHSDEPQPSAGGICPDRPPPLPGTVPAPGQGDGQPAARDGGSPPSTDAFALAPPASGAETGGFNPNMFGDHLSPSFVNVSSSSNQAGALATVVRGAFKIAENESPRPQDRLFFTYNYFNSVPGGSDASGVTRSDVHRVVMGFEKTVLDGNISVGVRAPFIRFQGDGSVGREDLGDPSIVLKYAFINDRQTGNVLSGGLVVTAPVGASFLPAGAANIHPTLFQPYVGAIYNLGDWYVQGFSSIILPTAHRDVTAWYNDVALGYFLYRTTQPGRLLTAVVPTIELHVTTPLNHHGGDAQPITGIDLVDLTAGVTFGVGRRSTLGLAVVTPLTGPRPFAVEGQAYLNCRF